MLLSRWSVSQLIHHFYFFFFKQNTAYEMRISDWSSDVCSSDLIVAERQLATETTRLARQRIDERQLPRQQLQRVPIIVRRRLRQRGIKRVVADRCTQRRSEERRVGKECVSTCSSRRSPNH